MTVSVVRAKEILAKNKVRMQIWTRFLIKEVKYREALKNKAARLKINYLEVLKDKEK